MKQTTMYTLCMKGQTPRGPHTAAECRAEIEAAHPTGEWHWSPQPDGSQLAVSSATGETLAEAVPTR